MQIVHVSSHGFSFRPCIFFCFKTTLAS